MYKQTDTLIKHDRIKKFIALLPIGQHFQYSDVGLKFQCHIQEDVKKLRHILGVKTWHKEYNKGCDWWEYKAEVDGVTLEIYAIHEAPKTCKAVITRKIATRKVPIEFKIVEVEEEVVTWECGDKS